MRRALTASLATLGVTFFGYLATLAPGLPPGHDSGEFAAAAALTGIAHPPGYPLFSLLSAPVAWLPVGSLCWRLNVMMALFVSLACACLTLATGLAWKRPWLSFLGSTTTAFSLTVWSHAVAVEKYALHLLLLSLWVSWAAVWQSRPREERAGWLSASGALIGVLALTYHYTSFLFLPGLAVFLWKEPPARFEPRALLGLGIGCLPLLFLPLRASQNPGLNWGDPSNWERWLRVVLREGYGVTRMGTQATSGLAWDQVGHYFHSLCWEQYPPFFALLIGLGLWRLVRERDSLALLLALGWFSLGPILALVAAQPEAEIYWDILQRLLSGSFFLSGGLIVYGLLQFPPRAAWGLGTVGLVAALWLHGPRVTLAGQYHLDDTVDAVWQRLPQDSLMVPTSDLMSGALLFRQRVKGERTDVTLIFPGLLSSSWYRKTLPEPLRAVESADALDQVASEWGRPLYWEQVSAETSGRFVPRGLVYQQLSPGQDVPARAPVDQETFTFLESQTRRGNYQERKGRPLLERSLIIHWANAYRTVVPSLEGEERALAATRVVEFQPEGVEDWLVLAEAQLAVEDIQKAQEALLRAYRLDPGRQDIMDRLREMFQQQGRSDEELLQLLREVGQ